MSSKETEFIVIDKAIQRKIPRRAPEFAGMLDSEPHTPNGGTMMLHVSSCPAVASGEKVAITVDILELDREFIRNNEVVSEGSDDDLLATFEGFLENKNGRFIFSEMKPTKEVDWKAGAFFPYFYITFSGENDKVINSSKPVSAGTFFPVIVGTNSEENEGDQFEIGFIIKKDGAIMGTSGKTASLFQGEYTHGIACDLFNSRTSLDAAALANITPVLGSAGKDADRSFAVASSTHVDLSATNRAYMKAVEQALKKIDQLVKSSKNPYFQNVEAVNEYYREIERYKRQLEEYTELKENPDTHWNDLRAMEQSILLPLAQRLNELEEKITGYLKSSKHPPRAYIKQIEQYSEIIARNKAIDELLNNPAVQILGLLPGAGVVTGALKLLQGKTFDGFLDIFGSIVTYGSFIKLSRVARAFRTTPKSTVELLYSYRYRNMVSQITSTKVMKSITKSSLAKTNTFLGSLFSTVNSFETLKGHLDSLAILHRNQKYILDMTGKAIAGIGSGAIGDELMFLRFLDQMHQTNATLEFFAHLRALHGFAATGKSIADTSREAMDEVQKLLGHQEVPGMKEINPLVASNTSKLFDLMQRRRTFDIDKIFQETTRSFSTDSSIIDYFTSTSATRDRFNVNHSSDIRYQNTRAEMQLALREIVEAWEGEQKQRDGWIDENRDHYVNDNRCHLMREWARIKKSFTATLEGSLETRIKNLIAKIQGQVEAAEALTGKTSLNLLEQIFRTNMIQSTGAVYDLAVDVFADSANNLIDTYFY